MPSFLSSFVLPFSTYPLGLTISHVREMVSITCASYPLPLSCALAYARKGVEEEIPPLSLLSTLTFSLSLSYASPSSTSSRTSLFHTSFVCMRARGRNHFSPTPSLFSLSFSTIIFYIAVSSSSALVAIKGQSRERERGQRREKRN